MTDHPNFLAQQEMLRGNSLSSARQTRWGHTLSTAQQLNRWGADPAISRELEALFCTFSCRASDFATKSLPEIAAHVEVFH